MYDERRAMIMNCELRSTFRCLICSGQFHAVRADVHGAGTPCVLDGRGRKGKDSWILVVFAKQRRMFKDQFFVSDHVPLAGQGDLTVLVPVLVLVIL